MFDVICPINRFANDARFDKKMLFMYKMYHGLVDIPIERFFVRLQSDHYVRTHHQYTIRSQFRAMCAVMQDSYFNRLVNVWNNLSDICVL